MAETATPPAPFRRSRLWREMTTEEFGADRMADAIAVLPLAAVEQHGPHLPTGVDAIVMDGMIARVRALMEQESDPPPLAVFLPVQEVGLSTEHIAFPGSLTLAPATAMAAWREIAVGVSRAGFRKLALVSSHGGNSPVMDVVGRAMRAEANMLVVQTSWQRLGWPEGLFDAQEIRHGIHGGEIETSLMLAFRPDLVRMERAENFAPASLALERDYELLRADRPAGFSWLSQDLHPSGAMGDASRASREKGEAAANHAAAAFVRLLREMRRFELGGGLRQRPGFL
ncbi:creatininase family protein [Camelimonas abortus]|uniref:Creatininase family protein n=1 Tax=Camelimonas abortus TaxID=1017184 RepID=A0ABV7LGJ3_9HYPH